MINGGVPLWDAAIAVFGFGQHSALAPQVDDRGERLGQLVAGDASGQFLIDVEVELAEDQPVELLAVPNAGVGVDRVGLVQVVEHPAEVAPAAFQPGFAHFEVGLEPRAFLADGLQPGGYLRLRHVRVERQVEVAVFLTFQFGQPSLQLLPIGLVLGLLELGRVGEL